MQYFSAWVSVFGPAQKLLCVWHVDRAWRRALKDNVASHELQVEVYHMLRTVMQEIDEEVFGLYLNALVEHLQQVAPRFATYFTGYCSRCSEWAYCFRKGTRANTNMYVESFHNVLKSAYMERKANRRVGCLLRVLMKIARDKAFERLIKVEKKKTSKKLAGINKRHVTVADQLPEVINGGWYVISQSKPGHKYLVLPASSSCECALHCRVCDCCPHMYQCSCVDFAVHDTVCKHAHTIHHLRQASRNELSENATNALQADRGRIASKL